MTQYGTRIERIGGFAHIDKLVLVFSYDYIDWTVISNLFLTLDLKIYCWSSIIQFISNLNVMIDIGENFQILDKTRKLQKKQRNIIVY